MRNFPVKQHITDFDAGLIIGTLAAQAHFGGDGRQPQVTLKLHVREEPLFRWLLEKFPAAKLYGPYSYDQKDGSKREFFQLMFRGPALREGLIPLLDAHEWGHICPTAYERYLEMKERYGLVIR